MKETSSEGDGMRKLLIAVALSVVAIFSAVGTASAGTDHYCSGCTIYAGSGITSTVTISNIRSSYVHRLSGPGSGVTIYAAAYYPGDGYGSWQSSTTTEAIHYYPGNRDARGAAWNGGAGNYGFNAHASN